MERNRVKGHNRVAKGKSGFKVIRVDDFFRKKDESRAKKIALGAGLLVGAGIGSAILLKGKGAKSLLTKKTNVPTNTTQQISNVTKEKVPVVKATTPKASTKKEFNKVEDPWETPILTKIQKNKANVESMVPLSKDTPLLTGKKIPARRDNLLITDTRVTKRVTSKAASDAVRIGEMEKIYKSISPDNLAMKATIKIDHYLKRPRKTSNLGRPPKETSLVETLDSLSIKKAQEKVTDRLSRAERRLLQKKDKLAKKN